MNEKANKLFADIENIAAQKTERKLPSENKEGQNNFYEEKTDKEVAQEKKENATHKNDAEGSGKTGGILAAQGIDTLSSLIERIIFFFRLSDEEKERIMEIDGVADEKLTPEDISLNRKFQYFLKKHEKIQNKIAMTEDDKKVLIEAFTHYSKITGRDLNPNLILYGSLINVVSSRAIDLLLT